MGNLKVVLVVPFEAPLDSGISPAGALTPYPVDGQALSGRPGAGGALMQSFNAFLMEENNAALTACGSAQATTTTKVKTTNTLTYLIDGVFKSKTATDNFWTLTGTAVTAGGSGATMHYALCIDGSGAASVIQGPTNQGSTTVWTPAPANMMPNDLCVAAVLKIALTAGTTFTPGTTNVATAGGVTVTFEDGCDATLWGAYQLSGSLI